MTETKAMSLLDFANSRGGLTYLWLVSVGSPAGEEYHHDTESDGEDYCDLNELIENIWADQETGESRLWELKGSIEEDTGLWAWDGEGEPRDCRRNSILNLKAR